MSWKRLNIGSRVNREVHARFWERAEVKFLRATRHFHQTDTLPAERARAFIAGPVLLVRLAPVDCHHVHYPDHGRTLDQDRLGHRLWTVNWHALVNKPDILFSNERISSARWRVDAGTSSATSEVLKIIHTRRSEQRICGVARSPSSTCRRYDGWRSELV